MLSPQPARGHVSSRARLTSPTVLTAGIQLWPLWRPAAASLHPTLLSLYPVLQLLRAAVCKRHSGNWSFHERSKYLSVSVATCITRPENYLKSWSPHSSSPGSFIFKDRVRVCLCVRASRMVWQVLRLGGSSLIHYRRGFCERVSNDTEPHPFLPLPFTFKGWTIFCLCARLLAQQIQSDEQEASGKAGELETLSNKPTNRQTQNLRPNLFTELYWILPSIYSTVRKIS